MSAELISGKDIAAKLREDVASDVARLKADHGFTPGLAVVLVGEDPASQIYVRNKGKMTEEAGMNSFTHRLAEDASQAEVEALLTSLNEDEAVDGILLQLPLPKHLDEPAAIAKISPDKDVDGLTEASAGRLSLGKPGIRPCTPAGCVILAKYALGEDLSGKNVVVIGRSILVGKPAALLFLEQNCTVTIAHSRTKDLPEVCRSADILVAAVGRPKFVQSDWVKPGACVIDVGINRIPAPEKGEGKTRVVGDVDFDAAKEVAGQITPVPGSVGPMTIAGLLVNTLECAKLRRGI
ncbi:MAG: bifunctional methylenetetrahydrofolate dehydrogenase/methenyltetrahydrofolate cyclohydrolase FolD [Ponticaulis sp.]|nr:bifunctional methylenetetrahydrofolate dehydrogenase/methenyltetrahydrofolate cyclohydrolase FolD [Ponticaulis sp.]|tara:strand:- start:20618 stop:21499 length:882 start_codon:yes stop_codon:yes gene_type:complete